MRPAIRIDNLSKRYRLGELGRHHWTLGDSLAGLFRRGRANGKANGGADEIWALKDVSFDVEPGEVVGIIGRNGAGKSTLLKILSRITEPTAGAIELRGRVSSLLEVGTGFHPELTGRENIYLNGSILGMKKAEIDRKLDQIIDFSGVERFLDTPVKRYSSGMQVRLAFAVAAHLEPEILIVDEVLAVGDAEFQRKCLGKMGDVAGSGRTVLFVSHNMAAVENLCTRALLLASGNVDYDGDVEEAVIHYLNANNARAPCLSFEISEGWQESTYVKELFTSKVTGVRSRFFSIGEQIRLGIELHIPCKQDPSPIHVAFLILDGKGTLLTKCYSGVQELSDIMLESSGFITCTISDMRLVPGTYKVAAIVRKGDRELLSGRDLLKIEILEKDVYGTGKLLRSSKGYFYPKAQWDWGKTSEMDFVTEPTQL